MKRLIYAIDGPGNLDEIAALLRQRHLRGWRWHVLADMYGEAERRGLPLAPIWERKAVLQCAAQGGLWGGLSGGLLAGLVISLGHLPAGDLRSSALWSFPISFACFGAWVGGLLGLSRDHRAVKPYLRHLAEGRYVIFIAVREVDERLVKKIMAMGGGRKLGELALGLSWRGLLSGGQAHD